MKAIVPLLLLAACAPSPSPGSAYDQAGNRYPSVCMGDLSYVKAPISILPERDMDKLHEPENGHHLVGWYRYYPPHIYIVDTVHGARFEDALRHERCHAIAGRWHPE